MEFTQEQKLYAELVQKAWENADFKKELIANPVAAIEKFAGKKLDLPAGKTIVVRDQTDDSVIYINIPAAVKQSADAQLSEEQLESVAGGIAIWPPIGIIPPWFPSPTFPTIPIETI
ncbi:NHLP leader peptide family natural product precursor [Flavobacterium sp. WLB]|uniref:NHLP leader peptide family RiPP precursor n=1 Tax=unclassified Flavobacterium TaxID=196869 RepID=UPI0006ABC7D2|nr:MULTISPECIES: NHLP leader peptide family RiPP precursor [unclassified Flavobacterium]KOP39314.1 TOMM propeptide domain-containing protein [Flavobacterium sp. VMW]OWU91587.1 TOMM propeptide domain-containing protein [Flavobacterium sp. NLM]PUU70750.1 NHLP leader peptide family natural product precursor [Flavobacterium sp. WLB]